MNRMWQMSVTSLNASLQGTGVLLRWGQCKRQNRINLEEELRQKDQTQPSWNVAGALECRAFALQNGPGDM